LEKISGGKTIRKTDRKTIQKKFTLDFFVRWISQIRFPQFSAFQTTTHSFAHFFVIKDKHHSCVLHFFVVPLHRISNYTLMFGDLFSTIDWIFTANMVAWLAIGFVLERISSLKRETKDLRIRLLAQQKEEEKRYQLLLEQMKQYADKPHALNDIQNLFTDVTKDIRRKYPSLTDTDLQVLTLIGLGVGNADILQFTQMSKRTYYKRRQLIAQRMNTTAAQLDELAKQLFTSK